MNEVVLKASYQTKGNGSYRCLALVDKYYGHQNYRLCFVGEELQRQNADVISRGRNDLIDNYTREEIKVEFILDCLYAKNKNQRTTEAYNIIAMSVLEFISKIPGQSELYTIPVYRDRISKI